MPRSREELQMETQTGPGHVTFEKGEPGCFVTRKLGIMLGLFFVASIITTAALVLYFAEKGNLQSVNSDSLSDKDSFELNDILNSKDRFEAGDKTPETSRKRSRNVRLPDSVKPERYEIRLIPFLFNDNFTFRGEIRIFVNVTSSTRNVTLHANELDIDESKIELTRLRDGQKVPIEKFSNDTEREIFVVHLKEKLNTGEQYQLHMKYNGILNDRLQGFYRSSYTVGNTTRWIATTQFQATDARRAFPCFDEPAMKARFKLFIGRATNMTSLSNMPRIRSGKPVGGLTNYVWDEYEESVPMSTYLVAFVVSDFVNITKGRFSVWARRDAIHQAEYALEIGPKCLKYYENFFQIDFPLPKVDMIALPDFAAGAMENWGLITYRETAMLYEEGVSTRSNKQRVASVISHELAHQWFGNLVTPGWWSDLWLNEGFASYVEYLGVEAVEPSWKIMEQFVGIETQNVFGLDALRTSHPISIEVHHPDEISEIFDRISYGKGASIIRMMDHFLTSKVFTRGLTRYLKKHKFSNAEQDDLWAALTQQAHEDQVLAPDMSVKTIMDTWTLLTGFPVITVERNYKDGSAVITQDKFLLYEASNDTQSEKSDLWWVPITYTTSDVLDFKMTYPTYWMKAEKSITVEHLPGPEEWVLFNIQSTGFYRVNYDRSNWQLLISHLKDKSKLNQITPTNRAQLIDDSLNLARAGLLDYDIALDVTQYLINEKDYLPWKSAFIGFSYLDNMLTRTAGYEKFKKYLLKLVEDIYSDIGFEDNMQDPQLVIYQRMYVLTWACSLGHKDCVSKSVALYRMWMAEPEPDKNNPISPNLKTVVYCAAIKAGGEEEWDFAWNRYLNANVGSEKDLLLESLGCSQKMWILSRYLEWAVTENSGIRKQDVSKVFGALSSNPIGQILSFDFIRSNWILVRDYLGQSMFTISSIMRSATKRINRKFELHDLVQFAKENGQDLGAANRAVDQAIEKGATNIRWMAKNYDAIVNWLSQATR